MALRILIVARPSDRARIRTLVDACRLPAARLREVDVESAGPAFHEDDWDVIVACSIALDDVVARGVPIVLLAEALTADVVLAAERGAHLLLFAHGPELLRLAILRAARERAERRALFDDTPIARALVDGDGRFVVTNAMFEQLLGRDGASLRTTTLAALRDGSDPQTVNELRRSLVDRTGDYRRLETAYPQTDGSTTTALESAMRVGDTAGGPSRTFVTIEDLSARREMENAVAASERIRALVFVSVADVIFFLQAVRDRFRFVDVNPAFLRATGLTDEQVVGKFVDEVIPEPSLSLVLAKYREAVAERRTVRWEEITDYPTGKKYGEVSVTPVVDADGVCRSLIGTVHDVTEMRNREDMIRLYANIVRSVQIGLTVWTVQDPGEPRSFTLKAFNPAAERTLGIELEGRIGHPLLEVLPAAHGTELVDLLSDVARENADREIRAYRFGETPELTRTLSAKGFALPGRCVGLAIEDLSTEARARALNAAEQRVLEMTAAGATFEDSLTALVLAIEELASPAIASILLLSPDGAHVVHGAAPHLPDVYNRAIDGVAIGPSAGSCGTAAYLRRSVIVTDIELDPLWRDYRDLAREHGLRACWSTPIVGSNDRVLGTFALYYREPRTPRGEELELIARANHVASIVIQRHDLDQQLRGLAARLEAAREEERTAIARDIHDQLGQTLTVLKMDIAWIERRALAPEGIARAALLGKLKDLSDTTLGLIQEVRRISAELRPGILDDLGLEAALAWQAEQFERRTGILCAVHAQASEGQHAIDRDLATTVFRAYQEALTNVLRHANARRVDASLAIAEDTLVLEVRDDGVGIRPEEVNAPGSLGLLGIRERARRVGGEAQIAPAEPHGTVVKLRLPLHHPTTRSAPPVSRS